MKKQIQAKIMSGLPGAKVHVSTADDVHFEAEVIYAGFRGQSLLAQHQMVYAAVADLMADQIHALSLKTAVPTDDQDQVRDVQGEISQLIDQYEVVLFMKGLPASPMCGFSAQVSGLLQQLGWDFHAVDILADEQVREGIKQFSQWPTIPQLYVRGQFIGGCDIVMEMHQSDQLAVLLSERA